MTLHPSYANKPYTLISIYPRMSVPTINSLHRAGGWAIAMCFMLEVRNCGNDTFHNFPLGGYSKGERLANLDNKP